MFLVKKNTRSELIKNVHNWGDTVPYKTTKELIFQKEELIIDPTEIYKGRNVPDIGLVYSSEGFYGFKREGFVLLVHSSNVKFF